MPHLRELEPTDLERVLSINQAARPAVGDLDRERLTHLVDESSIALCAEEAGAIAGFCLVLAPDADYDSVNYTWFSARYRHFIYLDRVAIVPEHRGRGVGQALYTEVERLARLLRPQPTSFTLEVNLRPRNEASLRFHARMGFIEVGRQETPYGECRTIGSLLAREANEGVCPPGGGTGFALRNQGGFATTDPEKTRHRLEKSPMACWRKPVPPRGNKQIRVSVSRTGISLIASLCDTPYGVEVSLMAKPLPV